MTELPVPTAPAPLDLNQAIFAHGDAVTMSRVPSVTLNNWTQRGVIGEIGKINRSGRRMYSVQDLVKLRVIGDLGTTCALTPSFAAAIAENTMPRRAVMATDDTGHLAPSAPPV